MCFSIVSTSKILSDILQERKIDIELSVKPEKDGGGEIKKTNKKKENACLGFC